MYKQIIVLFSCCMIMYAPLLGMNNDFVLKEIVVHNVGHDMQRQFAMLSKTFNKIVEDTYRPKKKMIEEVLRHEKPTITGFLSWNKDFSRCAWATFFDNVIYIDSPDRKKLQLTLVGLINKNYIKSSSSSWDIRGTCYHPVFEDNIRPFFDKEGRACFYNYNGSI